MATVNEVSENTLKNQAEKDGQTHTHTHTLGKIKDADTTQ